MRVRFPILRGETCSMEMFDWIAIGIFDILVIRFSNGYYRNVKIAW